MMNLNFNKFDMLSGKSSPIELHRQALERAYMKKCRQAKVIKDATKYHRLLNLNQGELNFGRPGDPTELG